MHGVKVTIPKVPCMMSVIYNTSYTVPIREFIFWDPTTNTLVPTRDIFMDSELMMQGPKRFYNQSDLLHSYCEGTISPLAICKKVTNVSKPFLDSSSSTVFSTITFSSGKQQWCPVDYSDMEIYGQTLSCLVTGNLGRVLSSDPSTGKLLYSEMFSYKVQGNNPNRMSFDLKLAFGHVYQSTKWTSDWGFREVGAMKDTSLFQVDGLQAYKLDLDWVQPSDFNSDIKCYLDQYMATVPQHYVPPNLTERVYDNLVIPNVNNIENIAGVKDIRYILPRLKKAVKAHNFKSLAELYLFWKYEYSTTMLDFKAYWAYFQALMRRAHKEKQIIRISDTPAFGHTTRYTISLPTYTASLLESVGLNLTSANVWDTLPFTFVLDWFINFGDILQRLHDENIIATLAIRYCTVTTKVDELITIPRGPFKGSGIRVVRYYRTVDNRIPTPDIDVAFKNPIHHTLDGAALVVAMRH